MPPRLSHHPALPFSAGPLRVREREVSDMAGLGLQTDPVCGMQVFPSSAADSVEHEDQTYYFCSPGCAERFDAEPERFISP